MNKPLQSIDETDQSWQKGIVAWFVRHQVAPNVLMLILLVGGALSAMKIKKEVFPEFDTDTITVAVPYPGASPEEVEQGIILAVEEATRGVSGIEEIVSSANEGAGIVYLELEADANMQRVYQDVQQEIDSIRTFPVDAEEPNIVLSVRRRPVVELQLYGDADEWSLRELAEATRDRLLQNPDITQVDLRGVRKFEVTVEIAEDDLRAYQLTMDQVASRLRASSIELPGGNIKTPQGEILLRLNDRREWAKEFAQVPIITTPGGAVVYLEDIATVKEGFKDTDRSAIFNGKRAIGITVFRVGNQTPTGISEIVQAQIPELETYLPEGIQLQMTSDRSKIYRQRLELLGRNLLIGLALVLCVLGFFLDIRLAFWVTMGIPTAFLGSFVFLPWLDVSINMISMFAFIVALGIVVDDAIVAGENIYEYRQRGYPFMEAAIRGAQEIGGPIGFSILTNMVAFMPLLFLPGFTGKIWAVIPMVVCSVFLISWLEALIILPAHLAHGQRVPRNLVLRGIYYLQQPVSRAFLWTVQHIYGPILKIFMRLRYITVGLGVGIFILTIAYVQGRHIPFIPFPRVEADYAKATVLLPVGTSLPRMIEVRDEILDGAARVTDDHEQLVKGIFAEIDGNEIEIEVALTDPDIRPIGTTEVTQMWRESVGVIPGAQSVRFEADSGGPGRGPSIQVELSHENIATLDKASEELAEMLTQFPTTRDIDDGYSPGKRQLNFKVNEQGRSLGLTNQSVARQLRNSFFGAEAIRQQRGRHEVIVRVRRPEAERDRNHDIETLMVRTPAGTSVPLRDVAVMDAGRAYTQIKRREGKRVVTVSSYVVPSTETANVIEELNISMLPQLKETYPGLLASFEGRQAAQRDSLEVMKIGFIIALCVIYALLAIAFRDYFQPVIVMLSIPFGAVGAVIGHKIMGYPLSLISVQGIIALSGVVVNDALVMIDYTNKLRNKGDSVFDAVHHAGVRRFRPILLTTMTTFGGLAPMIFETSRQAKFIIPMAISLGYGLLFATAIILVLIPCLYLIVDDIKVLFKLALMGMPADASNEGPTSSETALQRI